MQTQRIEEQDREDGVSPGESNKAVLGVLLSDLVPWSLVELVREFKGDQCGVEDSLEELAGCGLVHRFGDFAFPTLAARRIDRIGLD